MACYRCKPKESQRRSFIAFRGKTGEDTLKGYANSSVHLDIIALGPPRNLLLRYPLFTAWAMYLIWLKYKQAS